MRKINRIIIHHTATEEDTPESIKRYHTSYRVDGNIVTKEDFERRLAEGGGRVFTHPWSDIGYNYIIGGGKRCKTKIFKGRPEEKAGAHTKGHNHDSIGITVVMNGDKRPPTKAQMDKLVFLCNMLCQKHGIPTRMIEPHRKYTDKTCPGKKFNMKRLRIAVRKKKEDKSWLRPLGFWDIIRMMFK